MTAAPGPLRTEAELLSDDIGDQLARLDHEDEIEKMLAEIKSRRGAAN